MAGSGTHFHLARARGWRDARRRRQPQPRSAR
jgi:hypothetical protein